MDVTIRPDAAETLLESCSDEKLAYAKDLQNTVETGQSLETEIPKSDIEEILDSIINVDNFCLDELTEFDDVNSYYEHKLNELKTLYAEDEITELEFERRVEKLLEDKVDYEKD